VPDLRAASTLGSLGGARRVRGRLLPLPAACSLCALCCGERVRSIICAACSPRHNASARNPASRSLSPQDLSAMVAKLLKAEEKLVQLYSFSSLFGGGRSTGFGLIYDSLEAMKKFEPRFRLKRAGIEDGKKKRSRKQWKDQKKKIKRTWGTGKRETARAAKKAAAS